MKKTINTEALRPFATCTRADVEAVKAVNPEAAAAMVELFDRADRLYPGFDSAVMPVHQAISMLDGLEEAIADQWRVRAAVRGACQQALNNAGFPVDINVTRCQLGRADALEAINEAAGYLAMAINSTRDEDYDGGPVIDDYTVTLMVNPEDMSMYTVSVLLTYGGPTVTASYSSNDDLIRFEYSSSCVHYITIETEGRQLGTGADCPLRAALISYAEEHI